MCEESRTMILRNLFIKKKTRFYMLYFVYKRVVIRTLINCFDKFVYFFKIYMYERILVNRMRSSGIEICDTHRYSAR